MYSSRNTGKATFKYFSLRISEIYLKNQDKKGEAVKLSLFQFLVISETENFKVICSNSKKRIMNSCSNL